MSGGRIYVNSYAADFFIWDLLLLNISGALLPITVFGYSIQITIDYWYMLNNLDWLPSALFIIVPGI